MAPMKLRRREAAASSSGTFVSQSEEPQQQQESREERNRSNVPKKNRRKNTGKTTKKRSTSSSANAASAASTTSPLPTSSSSTSRAVLAVEDTSPDSKCPICLDRFNNLAYLDRCLHRFCFTCIQEWSRNKAECPLCKQPFTSILHTVRGENDFKKYTLRPRPDLDSVEATIAMVAAMAGDERMRLTLRRDRDGEDSRRHRHRRNRRSSVPLLEWIVHAPPGTLLNQPLIPPEEPRSYDLTEPGIVFEGLSGLGAAGNMPPFVGDNRETRRLLGKLAARQRLQREGGTVRPLRDREMVALRRGLYRCGIRVRGVARGSNYEQPQRGVSAESFCQNPSSLHRLRPWLRRELTVLYGAHDPLITIVVRLIQNALARLGLEDLEPVADELRPFLLARTDQFLHELASFARSPLNMESYDLHAVYEPPEVGFNFERIDSSDSSAVIAISEDEESERGTTRVDMETDNQPTSLSGWDDETPGPSYTTVDPSCYLSGFSPAPQESSNQPPCPLTPTSPRQRDEDDDVDVEEECLIVGYKKPIAERTPELVQLSSDSDEEKKEGEGEKKEKETKEKKTDGEKERSEGKDATEANDKQPETVLPTLRPTTPCREEIVEDAQPSRSLCLSPVLSPVLSPDSPPRERERDSDSRRRKREQRRNRRLRSGSSSLLSSSLHLPRSPSSHHRLPRSPSSHIRLPRSPSSLSSLGSDSDWAPRYSLSVSPLHSSLPSTPLSSSSSCFGFSPSSRALLRTPPPRHSDHGLAQLDSANVAEKPGGKRKYKSRHLDCDLRDPTWKPGGSGGGRHGNQRNRSKARDLEKTRREEREKRRRRRRRDRQRRESGESRCREERSPSVEIIYEGTVSPTPKRKRRRQKHSLLSSSPLVITLDSDSGRDLGRSSSACSSPFGSQQTVDFCHFPTLPLVHSSGVGGTLGGGDIGELPVDILDRESDKSDKSERSKRGNRCDKSSDLISLENSSDGSMDIDVESMKTTNPFVENFSKDSKKAQRSENKASSTDSRRDAPTMYFPESPDMADRQLLDSILSALDGISTKSDLPSTSNLSLPQDNHLKNSLLSNKAQNRIMDRFRPFYPSSLPPFLQLKESAKKYPQNATNSEENLSPGRSELFNTKNPKETSRSRRAEHFNASNFQENLHPARSKLFSVTNSKENSHSGRSELIKATNSEESLSPERSILFKATNSEESLSPGRPVLFKATNSEENSHPKRSEFFNTINSKENSRSRKAELFNTTNSEESLSPARPEVFKATNSDKNSQSRRSELFNTTTSEENLSPARLELFNVTNSEENSRSSRSELFNVTNVEENLSPERSELFNILNFKEISRSRKSELLNARNSEENSCSRRSELSSNLTRSEFSNCAENSNPGKPELSEDCNPRSESSNEARTLHSLDTHREIADSLLALRDPESSLTSQSSTRTQSTAFLSSEQNSSSMPDSDLLLGNLDAKTADLFSDLVPSGVDKTRAEIVERMEGLKQADLVHEKVCGDSALGLDVRNCAQTNAEDVK